MKSHALDSPLNTIVSCTIARNHAASSSTFLQIKQDVHRWLYTNIC
jgi:hypothetical protein